MTSRFLPDPSHSLYGEVMARMDYVEQREAEREAIIARGQPINTTDPEAGPSGFRVELPDSVVPIEGLKGYIRDLRVLRQSDKAREAARDVDVMYEVARKTRYRTREAGWPGVHSPYQKGGGKGSVIEDAAGNPLPNLYRPTTNSQLRRADKVDRMFNRRNVQLMWRNHMLRSFGSPKDETEHGYMDRRTKAGVMPTPRGPVADVASGAATRKHEGPLTKEEKHKYKEVDKDVEERTKKAAKIDRRLDRIAYAGRSRRRAQKAARKARELAARSD